MTKINAISEKIDKFLISILKVICIVMLLSLMVMVTGNILIRVFPLFSLHWLDEVYEFMFAYLIFYGAAAAWISREHFKVGDMISKRLKSDRQRDVYKFALEILALIFLVILFWYSLELTVYCLEFTAYFEIPKKYVYSCMPISAGIMLFSTLKFMGLKIMDFFSAK